MRRLRKKHWMLLSEALNMLLQDYPDDCPHPQEKEIIELAEYVERKAFAPRITQKIKETKYSADTD